MAGLSYCPACLTTFRDAASTVCPNLSCAGDPPPEGWGVVLQPGDLIDRHYKIERVLAVGGAGLTYLAHAVDGAGDPGGPALAVKVLYSARASGAYLRRLATEAQILQELDHEHIVKCRGFVQRTGHEPYLVTLFEDGGSLSHHLRRVGPLGPRTAAAVLRQILLGLDTAHQRGVVHRDLKPDNVLLAARVEGDEVPHVRVADFGIAKVAGGLASKVTKLGTFVGTPEYAAPEQFEQHGATAATDIFACGGLLYFMLTGNAPVALSRRADIDQSYEELLEQLPPTVDAILAPEATADELERINEIFANAMAVRSEHRWTAHQVIAALAPLVGLGPPSTGTLEVTREPAPKRSDVPSAVPDPSTAKDKGRTQAFLIGDGPEEEDEPTVRPAPDRAWSEAEEAVLVAEGSDGPSAPSSSSDPLDPPDEPAGQAQPAAEAAAASEPDAGPDAEPAAEAAAVPDPAPAGRTWIGLLLTGLLFLVVGSGVVALGVVGLAAIGLVAVDLPWAPPEKPEAPTFSLEDPPGLSGADRLAIQSALQKRAFAADCGATGQVVATVVVDPAGRIREVDIDEMFLRDEESEACLARALAVGPVRDAAAGRARVALLLE